MTDPATGSRPQDRGRQIDVLTAAKGGGFLAGGSFFEFAMRFVIAFLLARALGAADYGLYVLALSAAAMFSGLAMLGLDDAMVRYVAILSTRGDARGLAGTVQVGLGVSTLAGVVMGGVLYAGAEWFAVQLFDEPRLIDLLRFMAVLVPFLTLSSALAGMARGFGRMGSAALAENVVQSVVRAGFMAVLVLAGHLDLRAAVLVFGLADIAASGTLLVLLRRELPLRVILAGDGRRDVREIFAFALPLWMSGVLRQFRRNIETFMLGALAAASSVGVFAVVNRVNLVGHVFLLSILVAVKPILARLHDQRDRAGMAVIYRAATRWTLTLNIPFFLVMILYPAAILSVFGETFTAGATALVLLAFAELANAGTGICGPMLDMTGHTRIKVANSLLWTVLAVAGGLLLIPPWGVLGAAASALIAIATVNAVCVVEVWFLERFVPFDRSFLKPLGAGMGALACGRLLALWMPAGEALVPAIVQGAVVSAVYLGLLLAFRLPAEDRMVLGRAAASGGSLITRGRAALATLSGRSS